MFKRTIAAVTILAAIICLGGSTQAAKPTQWLIYWYVCGTDIETSRIAFGNGTNLMSDNPNALMLAEPDREPGDATRCIKEVERATLSPNVKIFMQAGGTYIWGHPKFRDLNAKIQTKVEVIATDGNGKPLIAKDKNDNPIKDEYGNYKYQTIYGDAISSTKLRVPQWFLKTEGGGHTVAKPVEFGKIGRYVYDKYHRNWHAREQLPIITGTVSLEDGTLVTVPMPNSATDMGSKEGLVSFLRAGQELERELYPEGNVRRVLIMKNHGGGYNICTDEYTKNTIHVDKINEAFAEVQGGWTNPDEKPFEVVAFDACLMSTYETAIAIKDFVKYMVASQETTWAKVDLDYTGLLNELSKNPSMSGKELGKIICNTTWKDSKVVDKDFGMNTNALFTLSVIDLSEQKMEALKTAYANFNEEATQLAQENSGDVITFAKFKNAANVAERYPSDEVFSKQWEMDLKTFTDNLKVAFPELKETGRDLVKALDKAIVYNKRGDVLNRGGGLSKQFPTDFYNVIQSSTQGKSVNLSGLADTIVEVDEEKKTASIELTEEELKQVESVRCQLVLLRFLPDGSGNDELHALYLGGDSSMKENRRTGKFESAFRGKWITLDGEPLYVQILSDSTRKNKQGKKVGGTELCLANIMLNGQPYKMFISRTYPNEKLAIIGVAPNIDHKVTLPSGKLESLKKGDVVVPIYYHATSEIENEFNGKSPENMTDEEKLKLASKLAVPGKAITIGNKPRVEMGTLPNADYMYVFQFINPLNSAEIVMTKEVAMFKLKDGKIVKVKHADDFADENDIKEFMESKD